MQGVESLTEVVLGHPLALAVLAASALAMLAFRLAKWRREREFWSTVELLHRDQFKAATEAEIAALFAFAKSVGELDVATAALAQVRRLHGREVKHGHLWWVAMRVRGELPPEALPPACTPGAGGLETVTPRASRNGK